MFSSLSSQEVPSLIPIQAPLLEASLTSHDTLYA